MKREASNAFCAIRPPGHHAEPTQAMGFCLFANAAIGAAHARAVHGVEQVAIIDFDVHHSMALRRRWSTIRPISTFPRIKRTSTPALAAAMIAGVGNMINVPLLAGSGSSDLRHVWQHEIEPALRDFQPGLILISAGFDAHHMDPLAELNFSGDDYAWLTQQILAVAAECCEGRVVSILEGVTASRRWPPA